jgi:hypothetical protein
MSQSERVAVGPMDRLGIVASAACAIHCLALPVILSLSSVFAHFLPTEEHTHRTLAVAVALIGSLALGTGYRKHRRAGPFIFMAVGLGLILATAYEGDRLPSHAVEVAITMVGSCCMIVAHRMNHTFCRECVRCC